MLISPERRNVAKNGTANRCGLARKYRSKTIVSGCSQGDHQRRRMALGTVAIEGGIGGFCKE